MLGWGGRRLKEFLKHRAGYYDVVLVMRPHNMAVVLGLRDEMPEPWSGLPLVYDAEALYSYPRDSSSSRQRSFLMRNPKPGKMLEQELALSAAADRVLAVSSSDAAQFYAGGCSDVRVFGHSFTLRLRHHPSQSAAVFFSLAHCGTTIHLT